MGIEHYIRGIWMDYIRFWVLGASQGFITALSRGIREGGPYTWQLIPCLLIPLCGRFPEVEDPRYLKKM